MELFELDKLSNPDESNAYTLLTPQGKEDPAANTQYFETERGTKYEIFFNPMTQPPATEVMFGVVEMGGTINFEKAYTSGPQEVVKIFNTVIKATLAYDQAQDWGFLFGFLVPLVLAGHECMKDWRMALLARLTLKFSKLQIGDKQFS
jgi:hypothetical protein